jgi:hypothetical protein
VIDRRFIAIEHPAVTELHKRAATGFHQFNQMVPPLATENQIGAPLQAFQRCQVHHHMTVQIRTAQ